MKVSVKPFQRLGGAAALGGRASQGAKFSYRSKRHERVNFGAAERGKTHKWGFPLAMSSTYFFELQICIAPSISPRSSFSSPSYAVTKQSKIAFLSLSEKVPSTQSAIS